MPRSSGQNAIPIRAIRSEEVRMMSRSLKRTEPVRLPMMPMIDFSVVVLPAPLRPSSVTTSPAFTLKLTPWRMCDSPYQASRFSTDRICPPVAEVAAVSAIIRSGMPRPQIGFLDALVLGQLGVIAFREHLPTGEDGDDVGQVRHHVEIMLDHQDRVFR